MEVLETVIPMPRIGDKAPAFKAVTTQGDINFPTDYAGKWIILFSHPADFTPVCTWGLRGVAAQCFVCNRFFNYYYFLNRKRLSLYPKES